jgi:hypothetical protein
MPLELTSHAALSRTIVWAEKATASTLRYRRYRFFGGYPAGQRCPENTIEHIAQADEPHNSHGETAIATFCARVNSMTTCTPIRPTPNASRNLRLAIEMTAIPAVTFRHSNPVSAELRPFLSRPSTRPGA